MTATIEVDDEAVAAFQAAGFVVLRQVFDAAPLNAEVGAALAAGVRRPESFNDGPGNRFQYVPMMTDRTPRSLALLEALAPVARGLLGADPIPIRAKGTRYAGSTGWHRDSESVVASIGFLVYLEPLLVDTGALRIIPGSHRPPFGPAPVVDPVDGGAEGDAVATRPGDIIAFDEHLLHASAGGGLRHQWRVDFVADPTTADLEGATRDYLAGTFAPGWDGGYDVDAFPSYDATWRTASRSWTERLSDLGAYELADVQEDAVRRG